jgi:hypothetical protein
MKEGIPTYRSLPRVPMEHSGLHQLARLPDSLSAPSTGPIGAHDRMPT